MVIGLAERIGFKEFEFEGEKIVWSALLNLSNNTSIKIYSWEENGSDHSKILLVELGTGEVELQDVIEVYTG